MKTFEKRLTSLIDEVMASEKAIELLGGEGGGEIIKNNCKENSECSTDYGCDIDIHVHFDMSCWKFLHAGGCPTEQHICITSA